MMMSEMGKYLRIRQKYRMMMFIQFYVQIFNLISP